MVSVSTLAFSGQGVLEFAGALRRQNNTDTGLELFFDTQPFSNPVFYHKYLEDFISSGRIGVHCPIEGCDILAEKGTLLLGYSLDRHEECMELAARVNSHYVVLHTNGPEYTDPMAVQRKKALFSERSLLLSEMSQKYGCELWVENVGFYSCRSIVYDFESYINLFSSDCSFYSLVDLGHAHINGWDIPLLLKRLGNRVRGLHMHDNDGVSDLHYPIYKGNIQWEPVFDAIKNLPRDCLAILEYQTHTPCEDIFLGIKTLRENPM